MTVPAPADEELRSVVDEVARERFGREVIGVQRRASPYRTSYPLEILEVALDDGATVPMVFKHLAREALTEEALRAKPEHLYDPLREIETYRLILAPAAMGTPELYAAAGDRRWLLIEKVRGVELYQVGEPDTWAEVAGWAARMHARFRGSAEDLADAAHLVRYDASFYAGWLDRARSFAAGAAAPVLDAVAGRYDELVEEMVALPSTFIHGELYASNVLVDRTADGLRVCPVDWEVAAVGPGLVDLAAMTAGSWSEDDRAAIVAAYRQEDPPADAASFDRGLALCRLHLAVQWLGWSPDWTPPAEHAHDWLGEAAALSEELAG